MDGAYQPNAVGRGGWVFTHDGDKTWTDYTYRVSYDTEMRAGGYLARTSENVERNSLM